MQLSSIPGPAALATTTLPIARRRYSNINRTTHAKFQINPPASLGQIRSVDLPLLGLHLRKESYFVCKNMIGDDNVGATTTASSWVDRISVPELIRPYIKLARLDGAILMICLHFGPTFWSILLATQPGMLPNFKLLGTFNLISFLVMNSCCASNDLIDLEYDKKEARCKTRPLVAGDITPLQGWLFWGLNIALLIPLLLKLNKLSIMLAAVEQVLWIAYPFMKRVTYWPQAFLGIVHNWGALIGWAAVTGNLNAVNIFLPLHIAGLCWTLVYDTIYAHQDKSDDAQAGVKSTALLFGDRTKNWLLGFATICIGALSFAGYNAKMGWPFYLSMIPAFGHLLWQIYSVDLSQNYDCLSKFLSNKWFAAIVMAGMVLGRMVY